MRRLLVALGPAIAVVVAMLVYWRTAFPSISWWENGELAAAASVLGVVHPPGSLIPTMIGWLFLKLPFGLTPAFQLNVLAGIVAAAVVALTMLVSVRLVGNVRQNGAFNLATMTIALGLAGLGYAFSRTVWHNATAYTPYIYTALFTAAIVWALLCWWKTFDTATGLRWMFIIFLLVGLDFSVHRTNALLIPGLGVAFLFRDWRTVITWRAWLAGIAGLAVGLSFFLIIMPMAAAHPPLNANDPSTFGRLWDYVTLKQYGGSFLVDMYPRKGAFWSDQVADYFAGFFANFAPVKGSFGILGVLPLILGVTGLVSIFLRDRRLALSIFALFLCTSIGAVVYFNVPANYFRAMDRHYLPSFVIFGTLMIVGALMLVKWVRELTLPTGGTLIGLLVIAAMAVAQMTANYSALDNSNNYAAYDTARNLLDSTPQNGIMIVGGDNDTYGLWYLRLAERERPDVTVLNISLLNTMWYVRQMQNEDTLLGFRLTEEELAGIGPMQWTDTTIAIPLTRTFAKPDGTMIDTARLVFPVTLQNEFVMGHDVMIRRILCGNAWQRPVYVSSFALGQLEWLMPYSRCEGIVRQIMPYADPGADIVLTERRLLSDYLLRVYADSTHELDSPTKGVGRAYWGEFFSMLLSTDDVTRRREWRDRMLTRIPLERIDTPADIVNGLAQFCDTSAATQ